MKIIHTSDWHLGHRLYRYDRTDEENLFFEQLAAAVKEEQPDALLVSGDVFDTGTPGNDVAKKFTERLLEVISECPTMETVMIAGNHDSYSRLVVDEALWKRCHVHVLGIPGEDDFGKAIFAENVVKIGEQGVVAAVPFCHERNFPVVEGSADESRMHAYFDALAKYARKQAGDGACVLMAHLAVGKETDFTGQDKSMAIGGQECVDPEVLGEGYDYIALGHIHCPQWIRGEKKIARYCGSPRTLHFDEIYPHGIDVVTVEAGKEPVVRTRKLEPMRIVVTVGGEKGLAFEDALKAVEELAVPAESYVRLNVALGEGQAVGPDWTERARQACAAKNLRYCVINPIRKECPGKETSAEKTLTVAELRELSNDKVLEILAEKRALTARQCELVRALMEEVDA